MEKENVKNVSGTDGIEKSNRQINVDPNGQPNRWNVNAIPRYSILEFNTVDRLITDFSLGDISFESKETLIRSGAYLFYPLSTIKKFDDTVVIKFTQFKKPSIVFQYSLVYNVPEDKISVFNKQIGDQLSQTRYGVIGICKYYSQIKNIDFIKPSIIFFDTISCFNFYNELFNQKKLGFYYFEFFKAKKTIIISKIVDLNSNLKTNENEIIKNMFRNIKVGWIQYDSQTYNEYFVKKMIPTDMFNPKKFFHWELLMTHYLKSAGVVPIYDKEYRKNYSRSYSNSYTKDYPKDYPKRYPENDYKQDGFSKKYVDENTYKKFKNQYTNQYTNQHTNQNNRVEEDTFSNVPFDSFQDSDNKQNSEVPF